MKGSKRLKQVVIMIFIPKMHLCRVVSFEWTYSNHSPCPTRMMGNVALDIRGTLPHSSVCEGCCCMNDTTFEGLTFHWSTGYCLTGQCPGPWRPTEISLSCHLAHRKFCHFSWGPAIHWISDFCLQS